jgi:ribose transport system permease protein
VLLTAGIDLSVGAVMFLGAAVCGQCIGLGAPSWLAAAAMLLIGPLCGLGHGVLIAGARMSPFIVTLGSLFVLRGAGLWISRTRAMNLPDEFTHYASATFLELPLPIWLAALVVGTAHFTLAFTKFGRQTLAVGHDPEAARKAGVRVERILIGVYVISGSCAAVAGLTMLAQLGAVSPTFGKDREFDAIAAAVLGGASLFGGRGNVFPGAVVGSVTVATVFNGLNSMNANPYIYPLITGGVIFLAVLLDGLRRRQTRMPPRITAMTEGGRS